jgi:hypothetical protein
VKGVFLAFFLVAALKANAGTVLQRSDGAVLSIDGHSYRLDFPESKEPRAYDAIVSTDGGKRAICLNQGSRTWFEREKLSTGATSMRFDSPLDAKVEKKHVEWHDEPAEPIAGHKVIQRVLSINYTLVHDMGGTRFRSTVKAIILLTAATDVPLVQQADIRTSFPEIDSQLLPVLSTLPGLLLAQSVTVTETYEGGKPVTDVESWTTNSMIEKPLPASLFVVPQGFVHQLPQIGAPGRQAPNQ